MTSVDAELRQAGERNKRTNRFFIFREWRHFAASWELTVLALPAILFIFVFSYIPMYGIILAFKNYRFDKGIFGSEWVGFRNFEFFFVNENIYRVLRNTISYNVCWIILGTFTGLLLAVLLNEISRKVSKFYQTAMFLPTFLSIVVVSYITFAFLETKQGYLNRLLVDFGFDPVMWYMEPKYWPFILTIVNLWKGMGFGALMYYAAIVGVDQSYYEAARIDGATRFQIAVKVTIPMIMPLIAIMLILSLGGLLNGDFGLFYFIPNNSAYLYPTTDIISTYVYRALMKSTDLGMVTAIGLFQNVVGFVLILLTNYVVRKINDENSLF